ncbi:MAG: hypothetical protein JW940_14890, partial [Polyangiaceae bacterium]|nr:hypothetical protein [Polyangiaceae bacterium]
MRSGIGVLAVVSVVAACGGKVNSDAHHRPEGGGGTAWAAGAAGWASVARSMGRWLLACTACWSTAGCRDAEAF